MKISEIRNAITLFYFQDLRYLSLDEVFRIKCAMYSVILLVSSFV